MSITVAVLDRIFRTPCPCDRCDHTRICKRQEMACDAFYKFYLDEPWGTESRMPNTTRYAQVFRDDDVEQVSWKNAGPKPKLSENQVRMVRQLFISGFKLDLIASMVRCSTDTIRHVVEFKGAYRGVK